MESEMKQPWFYHYIHSYSYSWYNIAAEFKINQSPDSGVTWLELTMPDRFPRIRQRKTLCQHNLTEYNNNTSNMYFYLIVLCRWVQDHLNTIKDMTVSVDLWNSIVTPGNNASQRKTGYRFFLDMRWDPSFDWYNAYLDIDLYLGHWTLLNCLVTHKICFCFRPD